MDIFFLVLSAVLLPTANMMAGGKFPFINSLFSRPLFYATPLVGIATYLISFNFLYASIVAASFLIWRFPGWGLWFDLNQLDQTNDPRQKDFFVKIINKISFGNDYAAFIIRNFVMIIPGLLLYSYFYGHFEIVIPLALMFATLITLTYKVSYAINRTYGVPIAEFLTGPVWWIFVMLGLTLAT